MMRLIVVSCLLTFAIRIEAKVVCPANSPYLVLLPNLNNCSKFYICSNEVPVEQSCPAGLIFNQNKSVCDYTTSVGLPESYCEYNDMLYEKAHSCDCTKYVICDYGKATVVDCPKGYRRRSKSIIHVLESNFSLKSMCKKGACNQ